MYIRTPILQRMLTDQQPVIKRNYRMQAYEVNLDHASALRLAESGATFLVLDVPERSVVLVDDQVQLATQQVLASDPGSLPSLVKDHVPAAVRLLYSREAS